MVCYCLFIVSNVFQIQNVFSKYFCGSIGTNIFVSRNTYKGKADHNSRPHVSETTLGVVVVDFDDFLI